jgi:hypothetical protein
MMRIIGIWARIESKVVRKKRKDGCENYSLVSGEKAGWGGGAYE